MACEQPKKEASPKPSAAGVTLQLAPVATKTTATQNPSEPVLANPTPGNIVETGNYAFDKDGYLWLYRQPEIEGHVPGPGWLTQHPTVRVFYGKSSADDKPAVTGIYATFGGGTGVPVPVQPHPGLPTAD